MGRARGPVGPALQRHLSFDPAQDAEQGQHQLTLTLAIEAAKANDLALADSEGQVREALAPPQAGDLHAAVPPARCVAAWAGRPG